jgi:nicotinamidase-related amidase
MKFLVVVDAQVDFLTGSLKNPEAVKKIPLIKERLEEAKRNNETIIFTQDTHYENYLETFEGKRLPIEHCIYKTEGWKITPELEPYIETAIQKNTFCSIALENIIEEDMLMSGELSSDCEIELCGFCTSICVLANAVALRAAFPNTKIIVNSNLCADISKEKHKAALEVFSSQQIDVIK